MKFEDRGAMDSNNYLKLKDKDAVKGLFAGEIYKFRTHWTGKQSELCSESNLCIKCSIGEKSKFRFRINFLVKEGSGYTAKVFEQGGMVYDALKAVSDAGYDLEKYLVTISRTGSGISDTSYSVTPVKDGAVGPELAKKLAAVPLKDLRHREEGAPKSDPDPNFTPEPAFDSNEEIPF